MTKPTIMWFRRDLRLEDNPALIAAATGGGPVIPVFILSREFSEIGAASRWRLEQALQVLKASLRSCGSDLILRKGDPENILSELVGECGAGRVFLALGYLEGDRTLEGRVKSSLAVRGVEVRNSTGFLLFEPDQVRTGAGTPYRVFSAFWKAVRDRHVAEPVSRPLRIAAPDRWPNSEALADWGLGEGVGRGADTLMHHCHPGESAAAERLDWFLNHKLSDYSSDRDRLDLDATSGMSEYLTWGEISPRMVWHSARTALARGNKGAESFLRQLVWRDFAWHLLSDFPQMADRNWRPSWDDFPWRKDNADARRWRQGMTGVPVLDAAMRQMYVTGRMHNRARMITASYLTKHLLTDWRVGLHWFAACLTDWDPACNALGWQWVAGSGPDAAPYFRIFNPETQMAKFDPRLTYTRHWLAERAETPHSDGLAYFEATPRSWNLAPDRPYPRPVQTLAEGRERALAAYRGLTA